MAEVSPSGEQVEITFDDHRAVVCQVGATLREYEYARCPVMDGFAADEMAPSGRGQVLAPWPNRLCDGKYTFDGMACQAPIDELDKANAIHGLVRFAPWRVAARETDSVRFEYTLFPTPGYPWCLTLDLTYSLGPGGLVVDCQAHNSGAGRLPFGIGFHPYLTCGAESIDTAHVSIPARRILETDGRQIPNGSSPVMGTSMDFRSGARIGKVRLDTCFCELERDGEGLATVEMHDASTGRSVALWAEEPFRYLMIYTGDTLGERERRRRGFAVEPMTCPPNALATGEDLVVLDPGQSWSARWGISPGR